VSGFRVRAGAVTAVAAVAFAAPSAAVAVTRTVDFGQPGRAQMRAVRGWWNPNGGTLRIPARHVGRTPMSRAPQTICADVTLYRFTAQYYEQPWAFEDSWRWCRSAAPGRQAQLPAWRYAALACSSYNVSVTITWRVKGGAPLSSVLYEYDRVADYRCETKNCASAIRYGGVASIRFES
jgi:hypothetical protein